jgi:uncharacterized protein (TIGR00369 family)
METGGPVAEAVATTSYPPARHLLRDLRVVFDGAGEERTLSFDVVPEVLTDRGALDAGVAATLIDIQSGGAALEAVAPDWIVTSDLTLHMLRPVGEGPLVGRTKRLRAGRNNVVLETSLWRVGEQAPVASAQLGFTRIVRRDEGPNVVAGASSRTSFALPESGLRAPVYEQLGLRAVDADRGVFELDVTDYQRNSVGALQGGVAVALATRSVQALARARVGSPLVTTDLTAHYLALGNVGPIRSEAVVLRAGPDELVARVELRDPGQEGRLCTVVTATARPFG